MNRSVLFASATLLVLCAPTTRAAEPGEATKAFEGVWLYAESCGWNHSASLDLKSDGKGGLQGEWSDGTRVWGEEGLVQATLKDGKAYMRFCTNDPDGKKPDACPKFGEEDSYAVPAPGGLDWFNKVGTTGEHYEKYLTLGPQSDGSKVVAGDDDGEEDCPDEEQ